MASYLITETRDESLMAFQDDDIELRRVRYEVHQFKNQLRADFHPSRESNNSKVLDEN